MNHVKDVVGPYRPATTTNPLADLVSTVLGYSLGQAVLSALVAPDEVVTPQNLRDRLRVAIHSGNLPALTPKRLEKLQAALELGRQLYVQETQPGEIVDTPERAAATFQCIAWEPVEKFAIASLDTKHRLLACRIISSGTATETLAHPREVFAAVMRSGGTRFLIAHNHPSGCTKPSEEDISMTRQLLAASKVMGLPMLDHIIVSRGGSTSLRATTNLWVTETKTANA